MTQGFYEQLGVAPDADIDRIRAAYGRAVAHLMRRRESTLDRGGDAAALDLARVQLDEAWEVLADPARRRRYDAMLAVAGDGLRGVSADGLWKRVAGAMIHPAVAAAARLVDATTTLGVGPLPEPPMPTAFGGATNVWDEGQSRVPGPLREAYAGRRVAREPDASASVPPADVVVTDPELATSVSQPDALSPYVADLPSVVDVAPAGAPTLPGPSSYPGFVAAPRPRANAEPAPDALPSDPERWMARHGPSGALLRTAREAKRLSISQLSEATRISARFVEALENEDYAALPSTAVFVRGYVREIARRLDLDVEKVTVGYMRRFSGDG